MQTTSETQSILEVLAQYAEALNSASTALLPSFYTADGVFMPAGARALPASTLAATSTDFFTKMHFHIRYAVQAIAVEGSYAFVQSTAHTTTTELATGQAVRQTSRDFFVLRQQAQEWKIFCYLFNNVRAH